MASKLSLFLAELKRRKVYRVAMVYVIVGVGILGAAEVILDPLGLGAVRPYLVILVLLGFPIALVLAWAYEVKPEGPRLPEAMHSEATQSQVTISTTDQRPSVAVLPFANLGADPENEYFSDGITFDIINHLAKISGLKVISRTSIMRFKATEKPLQQVGEELGVTSIVEGEIQRAGDRVRISAQLVDARTDEHLWADQYDRELLDVFAIQSEVAQRVASALKTKLTHSVKERIERRPTGNFDAYALYLKGRYFWDKRGEGLTKGLECFQEALEIDPEYALAHAGVADCYTLLGFYGYLPPTEAWPRARISALRALEIDDGLAEAHTSIGWVKLSFDWDPLAAEKDFLRAIELNPGYAPAHYWYAASLLPGKRFEEAAAQVERAEEVDPLSVFVFAQSGWVHIGARQFQRSREKLNKAMELDPNHPFSYWLIGMGYGIDGRFEESIRHLKEACRLSGDYEWFLANLGWAYGASGQKEAARAILERLIEKRPKQFIRSLYLSMVCIGLEEKEEALDWLESAYDERDLWMVYLGVDGVFDSLRAESRFDELLEKVGMEK